jgi:ribosomal-protein-alanine N-acetyltransferase
MLNPATKEPITLKTENYSLRTLIADDATQTYLSWMNDPEVNRYLDSSKTVQSIQSIREYINQHNNRDSFLFGIIARDAGHIGNVALKPHKNNSAIHLGVMVGNRDFWGRSVIIEARSIVLDFCFTELGLKFVESACYGGNIPAVFNFMHQGYEKIRVEKNNLDEDNPKNDLIVFQMSRENWFSGKNK